MPKLKKRKLRLMLNKRKLMKLLKIIKQVNKRKQIKWQKKLLILKILLKLKKKNLLKSKTKLMLQNKKLRLRLPILKSKKNQKYVIARILNSVKMMVALVWEAAGNANFIKELKIVKMINYQSLVPKNASLNAFLPKKKIRSIKTKLQKKKLT